MEFWRRWRVVSMVALLGAVSAHAFAAPPDPAKAASELENAKNAAEAVAIRTGILSDVKSLSLVDKDAYGSKLVGPFGKLLANPKVEVHLNAAITIAQLGTLSTDATLEDMLKNPNPAVRYWGAQGLANIMPAINSVGDGTRDRAIKALSAALTTEQSGLVKLQIINALGKAGDIKPLLDALSAISTQIQDGKADAGTLDAASSALNQFDTIIRAKGGMAKTETSAIAKAAAWTASFTAQQQMALKEKRQKGGGDLPDGYSASAAGVVTSAVHVLNDLTTHGSFKAPTSDDGPEGLQVLVDGLVGSASAGPGDLQKVMPDVPVPPAIKK